MHSALRVQLQCFAEEDDGSCEFFCPGCTDSSACNFDGALCKKTEVVCTRWIWAHAIAKGMSWMRWASAAGIAHLTPMEMGCVTMKTSALGCWTPAGCAMVPAPFTHAVVQMYLKEIATAMAVNSMRAEFAGRRHVMCGVYL